MTSFTWASAKSKTLKIISFSTSSNTPSSSLTPTMVLISSSVINGSLALGSPPNNLINIEATPVNNIIKGFSTLTTILINLLTASDTLSDFCFAIDFGVISPKINTITVSPNVTIPTPPSPHLATAIDVANEDAPIFTILFPINIAPNNLLGSSISFSTNFAPLTPSSTICLTLILLKDIKAVSDIEKNADRKSRIISIVI